MTIDNFILYFCRIFKYTLMNIQSLKGLTIGFIQFNNVND